MPTLIFLHYEKMKKQIAIFALILCSVITYGQNTQVTFVTNGATNTDNTWSAAVPAGNVCTSIIISTNGNFTNGLGNNINIQHSNQANSGFQDEGKQMFLATGQNSYTVAISSKYRYYSVQYTANGAIGGTISAIMNTSKDYLSLPNQAGQSGNFLTTNGTDASWSAVSAGTSTLTNTHILVGNASNAPTDVAMSGGATISNTGAVTIVTNANLTGDVTSVGNATTNVKANNMVEGYTTTVTSGGTLVLTNASTRQQYFTGTTTHTMQLPLSTTMTLGQEFQVWNNSSDVVTITSSNGNILRLLGSQTQCRISCIALTGTGASSWNITYAQQISLKPKTSMVTVVCGNSITTLDQYSAGYLYSSTLHMANLFGDQPMRFKRMVATTRTDRNGVYAYSGQTLPTILADLEAQWFVPLAAANIVPELVVGKSLIENDIKNAVDSTTCANSINKWIATVRAHWHGVPILLCTPHPGAMYTTSAIRTVWQQITNYMKSLDNGTDMFVFDNSQFQSILTPGFATYVPIQGSIATSTLTVTSATAGTIRQGATIGDSANTATSWGIIRVQLTGTVGGVGTYLMSTSNTVSSQRIFTYPNTDNQVHPNERGGGLYGRQFAKIFGRMATSWQQPYQGVGNCYIFDGSGAASGTNTSGTVCTNLTNGSNATGTYVLTANQPFQTEQVSSSAQSLGVYGSVSLGQDNTNVFTLASPCNAISNYLRVKIVSGAANLREIHFRSNLADATSSAYREQLVLSTNATDPDWLDGDILTFTTPPEIPTTGSITAYRNYMDRIMKVAGGTTTIQYLASGAYIIDSPTAPTVVNNSTSGNTTFNQTVSTAGMKQIIIYCNAALGTASYTYPAPFTNTPAILTTNGIASSVVTSNSNTACTITGATNTGYIILIGN